MDARPPRARPIARHSYLGCLAGEGPTWSGAGRPGASVVRRRPATRHGGAVLWRPRLDGIRRSVSAGGSGCLWLISHDQAQAVGPQKRLKIHLDRIAADRPGGFERHVMGDQIRRAGGKSEPSTRTRGLSYMANAVVTAAAHGVRVGACSTRSVHPLVVAAVNDLIGVLDGDVVVENPYLYVTKGDVCRIAVDAGLDGQALAETVSCSLHSAQRKDAAVAGGGRHSPRSTGRPSSAEADVRGCSRVGHQPRTHRTPHNARHRTGLDGHEFLRNNVLTDPSWAHRRPVVDRARDRTSVRVSEEGHAP